MGSGRRRGEAMKQARASAKGSNAASAETTANPERAGVEKEWEKHGRGVEDVGKIMGRGGEDVGKILGRPSLLRGRGFYALFFVWLFTHPVGAVPPTD